MNLLDQALQCAINGDPDKSEELLRSAPDDDPRVLFNLGWHDMRHGHLLKGFHGMNVGRFISVFGSPAVPGPIWRDEPLEGKTLLFRSEGGFGDEIANFRFAQEFKNKGAQVVVSGHPSLLPIFARHGFPCVTTAAVEQKGVYYDYWVPAMSAAYILEHQFDTLPGKAYLQAKPVPLAKKPNTIKVGLRWSGNPQFEHEQHRRFNPQLMIDLHNTNGVTCFSFQKDHDLQDVPFEDLSSELKTWEDTASHLMSMDLVITSCTSVAHMAGALGIETWVIVPVLPYYTWAVPGEKSAWYDSVTLFRQTKYGQWDDVFEKIQGRLQERLKQKEAA
jgi:hypothetical protein